MDPKDCLELLPSKGFTSTSRNFQKWRNHANGNGFFSCRNPLGERTALREKQRKNMKKTQKMVYGLLCLIKSGWILWKLCVKRIQPTNTGELIQTDWLTEKQCSSFVCLAGLAGRLVGLLFQAVLHLGRYILSVIVSILQVIPYFQSLILHSDQCKLHFKVDCILPFAFLSPIVVLCKHYGWYAGWLAGFPCVCVWVFAFKAIQPDFIFWMLLWYFATLK